MMKVESTLDVIFLYFLLPRYGMNGYFFSFLVTHLINFLLSLRRLLKIAGLRLPLHIPVLSLAAVLMAVSLAVWLSHPILQCSAFLLLLGALLTIFGILHREDAAWIRRIITDKSFS